MWMMPLHLHVNQKSDYVCMYVDSLIMAKCFIFLCIFGDLDCVETGVSEEGTNSLKALPKSSKLLWRVKTLIII